MDLTDRSRARVDGWLEDLHDRYGAFDRVDKQWTVPPWEYERDRVRFENDANGGAGVWLTNGDGEVLLVRDEGEAGWADPGGKREAGEDFETAAWREVREETGVACRVTDVLEGHVIEIDSEADRDRPTLVSLVVVFAGEYVEGEVRPRDGEIAAAEWFGAPPDRVAYPEVADRPYPASE